MNTNLFDSKLAKHIELLNRKYIDFDCGNKYEYTLCNGIYTVVNRSTGKSWYFPLSSISVITVDGNADGD